MIKVEQLYQEEGIRYMLEVKYGMNYIEGNSEPYFSITADNYEQRKNGRYVIDSYGCLHDVISKYCPKLKELISFHLWGQNTALPTYYFENGYYHYENRNENTYFLKHCLLKDVFEIPFDLNKEQCYEWLEQRKPYLQELFVKTMNKYNVEFINL